METCAERETRRGCSKRLPEMKTPGRPMPRKLRATPARPSITGVNLLRCIIPFCIIVRERTHLFGRGGRCDAMGSGNIFISPGRGNGGQ